MLLLLLFGYHGAGRCPGQSRGFAFVEFNLIQEATRWMETNQVTFPYTDTHTHIYMHTMDLSVDIKINVQSHHAFSCSHDIFRYDICTQEWRKNCLTMRKVGLYILRAGSSFLSTDTEANTCYIRLTSVCPGCTCKVYLT